MFAKPPYLLSPFNPLEIWVNSVQTLSHGLQRQVFSWDSFSFTISSNPQDEFLVSLSLQVIWLESLDSLLLSTKTSLTTELGSLLMVGVNNKVELLTASFWTLTLFSLAWLSSSSPRDHHIVWFPNNGSVA